MHICEGYTAKFPHCVVHMEANHKKQKLCGGGQLRIWRPRGDLEYNLSTYLSGVLSLVARQTIYYFITEFVYAPRKDEKV